MKLAILTSNHLRHKALAYQMAKEHDIVGLFMEDKHRDPSKAGAGTPHEAAVQQYFEDRQLSERAFFEQYNDLTEVIDPTNIHDIAPPLTVNDPTVVAKIRACTPDLVVVFGSSILEDEIISAFPDRIINMHLGLSPYYRGSGTNFWPLYDEKPEYVGVTIHYLDAGIDTGHIIAQTRPIIEAEDTPHSIGNKTIAAGIRLFLEVVHAFEVRQPLAGVPQRSDEGKLCLFKHFTEEHLVELLNKFDNGLVAAYLERVQKGAVDKVKLVRLTDC